MIAVLLSLVLTAAPAFHTELIFAPTPQLPMNHASSVLVLPDGEVLCAWYAGSREGARDVKIYLSRRGAASGRWSVPTVIADTPNRSEGNPVLYLDDQGTLWLYFVTIHGLNWAWAKIKVQSSSDGGTTWSPARILGEPAPRRGGMTRSHLLRLSDGLLLLPLYDERRWRSLFLVSDNNGQSWRRTGAIGTRPGNLQPSVVERPDGSLLALMRHHGQPGRIWKSVSADQGQTWTPAELMDLPNPDAGIDLAQLPNGHLVLAFNNSSKRRTPLSVAISEDGGRTWPWIRDLETAPGEYSYPSLAVSTDGAIHLTYTWKRESIKYARMNEEWIREGGQPRPGSAGSAARGKKVPKPAQ